jgi:hypothetical protein
MLGATSCQSSIGRLSSFDNPLNPTPQPLTQGWGLGFNELTKGWGLGFHELSELHWQVELFDPRFNELTN